MSDDFGNLLQECRRFGVEYGFVPERCAHELLAKLDPIPGTVLNWIVGREWQLEQNGRVVISGSFEDCAVELAKRCAPPVQPKPYQLPGTKLCS